MPGLQHTACRQQLRHGIGTVLVDERLRRHEAARERHVELLGVGLAAQLDGGLLGLAGLLLATLGVPGVITV